MDQNNFQSTKSKIAAGIFGIMWGAFGVHKFYLGYAAEGGIMLGVWLHVLSCVSLHSD